MEAEASYKFLDQGGDNFFRIHLTEESQFPLVEYQYGAVKFIEEHNHLRLSFEYEIFSNPRFCDTESDHFINYIGEILSYNIEKVLKETDVV